jgi:hypothetical protein
MKKKVALALLIVVLIIGSIAGGVYAAGNHQKVHGEKLVGLVPQGYHEIGLDELIDRSVVRFTNPDCVGEIIITQVSILRGTDLIYEGDPLSSISEPPPTPGPPITTRTPNPTTLGPHESLAIPLVLYMWDIENQGEFDPETVTLEDIQNPDNWLEPYEANLWEHGNHTVEIAWEAKKGVCPLIGWQRVEHEANGEVVGTTESPMVNLEQKKK